MIQLPMTQEQFNAKAKTLADEEDIHLNGGSGVISKSGVSVSYQYDGRTLSLVVTKKPMLVSVGYCEKKMRDWLGA